LLLRDLGTRLNAPRGASVAVAEGVTVAPFASFPDARTYPIGIAAAPDGTLYVSELGKGAIHTLDEQGNIQLWISRDQGGQIRAPGALTFGADGAMYAIDYPSSDPNSAEGLVVRITPEGRVTPFGRTPEDLGLPLFAQMTFDSANNLYVTDPATAEVWRISPDGTTVVWWNLPPNNNVRAIPTGITFDPARNRLYISDSGTGTIYEVDPVAFNPTGNVLLRRPNLDARALTMDENGRLLMLVWEGGDGVLARVSGDQGYTTLARNFRNPTGIIYDNGRAYVVNSDTFSLLGRTEAVLPFTVDLVTIPQDTPQN
jgi:sugar lactone lactonase YvrE